jgi:hypothetical protein
MGTVTNLDCYATRVRDTASDCPEPDHYQKLQARIAAESATVVVCGMGYVGLPLAKAITEGASPIFQLARFWTSELRRPIVVVTNQSGIARDELELVRSIDIATIHIDHAIAVEEERAVTHKSCWFKCWRSR